MQFLHAILRILFGEPGSADIVVTRSQSGTSFRLPNQRPQWDAQATVLVILVVGLAYGIFLAVNGTLQFPEDERNYLAMAACIGIVIAAVFVIFFRVRIDWHYELILTPAELGVHYVASGKRWRTTRIDMISVRQLTILRRGLKSLLQAESQEDSVTLILREQDHDLLFRLADLLAQEWAALDPTLPALRVAIETPRSIQPERWTQPLNSKIVLTRHETGVTLDFPLNSKIVLTRHETGVTLDFPLPDDPRYRTRRNAWRTFEVGIITLVGTLIGFVVCEMLDWRSFQAFIGLPFTAGLFCLVAAAVQSGTAWHDSHADNDLCQLSVAGNLLIRTSRDHRKQVWYRDEIRAIALVEDKFEAITAVTDGKAHQNLIQLIHLVVELHNGDHVNLRSIGVEWSDELAKAELEWIAAELHQSLFGANDASSDGNGEKTPLANAIQPADNKDDQTRITP